MVYSLNKWLRPIGLPVIFSWRQLRRKHSLSSLLNEMAVSSARFFPASEDDIARFIEETKNKNTKRKPNQDVGLWKALLRQTKSHRSLKNRRHKNWMRVYRSLFCLCKIRLHLLWTIISTCRRHRKKSEEEKLQTFYYPVSWQYFACNFAVYVTLMIKLCIHFCSFGGCLRKWKWLIKLSSVVLLFWICNKQIITC